MTVQVTKRLFTAKEYHQMIAAGLLSEDDPVELIKGEIVTMTPVGSLHVSCVNRLNQIFSRNFGERLIVSVKNPIRLLDDSEPEPDIALLKPRSDFYAEANPGPEDVFLLVEVGDTSAAYDQEVKIPLYGQAGIPECWLVDLAQKVIEVYYKPTKNGYQAMQKFWPGQQLESQVLADLVLTTDEVFGL